MSGCRTCRKRYARNLARYLAATPTATAADAADTTPVASTTSVAPDTRSVATDSTTKPLALVKIKEEVVEDEEVSEEEVDKEMKQEVKEEMDVEEMNEEVDTAMESAAGLQILPVTPPLKAGLQIIILFKETINII
jgi:hypothetical protein